MSRKSLDAGRDGCGRERSDRVATPNPTTPPDPALEAAQRIIDEDSGHLHNLLSWSQQVAMARALLASSKEVERMREALERIAAQKLLSELFDDGNCTPDVEGGYDALIIEARASLPRGKGE